MRIGCFGSHSTGKTTLVELVGQQTGLFVGNEIARQVAHERGITPAEIGPNDRIPYQAEVLRRQVAMERALSEFIFDRTVIDVLAYSRAAFEDLGSMLLYPAALTQTARQVLDYDLLLYFPIRPEIGVEDDGERHVDPAFQTRIDGLIWQVIADLSDVWDLDLAPKIHTIASEGPENRLREVLGLLAQKGFRWNDPSKLPDHQARTGRHLFHRPAHPRGQGILRGAPPPRDRGLGGGPVATRPDEGGPE